MLLKKGHHLQQFHQPKYVWMNIKTEFKIKIFNVYIKYHDVNFSHSLNMIFLYVVTCNTKRNRFYLFH